MSVYAAILRVAGLTAQRLGKVSAMRWEDLDLARREWRQPTNKSNRPHTVPLSDAALAIVQQQPRRKEFGSLHDVDRRPSRSQDRKLLSCNRPVQLRFGGHRLDAARPQGTAATLLAEAKVMPVVIEQLLGAITQRVPGGLRRSRHLQSCILQSGKAPSRRLAGHDDSDTGGRGGGRGNRNSNGGGRLIHAGGSGQGVSAAAKPISEILARRKLDSMRDLLDEAARRKLSLREPSSFCERPRSPGARAGALRWRWIWPNSRSSAPSTASSSSSNHSPARSGISPTAAEISNGDALLLLGPPEEVNAAPPQNEVS